MSDSSVWGLLGALQDTAQAALAAGTAVVSDLQQQLAEAAKQQQKQQSYGSSSSSSSYLRKLNDAKEEMLAHLRWSTPLLQPNTHLPLPTEWDARTLLAFLDCLRALQYSYVTVEAGHPEDDFSSSSSSSSYLTIPPATSALVTGLLLVFTRPGGVALRDVALSPYRVLDKREYWRLLSCHLVHLDAAHLLTNLAALLPDCAALESREGSLPFALDLLLLALASSLACVGAAVLHKRLLGQPAQYYSMLTVGASSLGFALKVWSGCQRRHPESHLLGLASLPSQFAWVPNLALTHLLVPQASFTAHMAGVCAGLCRAYALNPVLQAGWHTWTFLTGGSSSSMRGTGQRLGGGPGLEQQQQQQQQQQQRGSARQHPLQAWRQDQHARFLGSTNSSSIVEDPTGAGSSLAAANPAGRFTTTSSSSSSSSKGWVAWLWPSTEVLLQLGCVGAAVGVYVVCSTRSGQQGRSSYSSSGGLWRR